MEVMFFALWFICSVPISILLTYWFYKHRFLTVEIFQSTKLSSTHNEHVNVVLVDSPQEDNALDGLYSRVELGDMTGEYGRSVLSIPLSIAWFALAVLLYIGSILDPNIDDSSVKRLYLVTLTIWIFVSTIILVVLPVMFLIRKAELLPSMQDFLKSKTLIFILLCQVSLMIVVFLIFSADALTILITSLLTPAILLTTYFVAQYWLLFVIHSFFIVRGWDFLAGEGTYYNVRCCRHTRLVVTSTLAFLTILLSCIVTLDGYIGVGASLSSSVTSQSFLLYQVITEQATLPTGWAVVSLYLSIGPLLNVIAEPAGTLELLLNSELYTTLSKFDWTEFNRRTRASKKLLDVRPYSYNIMLGILSIYVSLALFIGINFVTTGLSGFVDEGFFVDFKLIISCTTMFSAPTYVIVLFNTVLFNRTKIKQVYAIAELGYHERRDIISWVFLVLTYLAEKQEHKAIAKCKQFFDQGKIYKENYLAHYYLGLSYALLRQHDKAIHELKESIRYSRDNVFSADVYMELGVETHPDDLDQAIEYILKARELRSDLPSVNYNLGVMYDKSNDLQSSVHYYKLGIKQQPWDHKSYINLGLVLEKQGKHEEAATYLKIGLELDPNDMLAKLNLAVTLSSQGKVEECKQMLSDIANDTAPHSHDIRGLNVLFSNLLHHDMTDDADKVLKSLADAYYIDTDCEEYVNDLCDKLPKQTAAKAAQLYAKLKQPNIAQMMLDKLIKELEEEPEEKEMGGGVERTTTIDANTNRDKAVEMARIKDANTNRDKAVEMARIKDAKTEFGSYKTKDDILTMKMVIGELIYVDLSGSVPDEHGRRAPDPNKAAEALPYLECVLELVKDGDKLDPMHTYLREMVMLATAYQFLGRFADSIPIFLRALEFAEQNPSITLPFDKVAIRLKIGQFIAEAGAANNDLNEIEKGKEMMISTLMMDGSVPDQIANMAGYMDRLKTNLWTFSWDWFFKVSDEVIQSKQESGAVIDEWIYYLMVVVEHRVDDVFNKLDAIKRYKQDNGRYANQKAFMNGECKIISLCIAKQQQLLNQNVVNFSCDGCGQRMTHIRINCLQCEDFDLCGNCKDFNDAGHKKEHKVKEFKISDYIKCDANQLIELRQQIIEKDGCTAADYDELMEAYKSIGKKEEAAKVLENGLNKFPNNALLRQHQVINVLQTNDFEGACKLLSDGEGMSAEVVRHVYQAVIGISEDAAFHVLCIGADRFQDDTSLLLTQCQGFGDREKYDEAIKVGFHLIECYTEDEVAQKGRAYGLIGKYYASLAQYDDAQNAFLKCVEVTKQSKIELAVQWNQTAKEYLVKCNEWKVSTNYLCDGCSKQIGSARFHCIECKDFDLCEQCKGNEFENDTHKKDHQMKQYVDGAVE
eukprot:604324_1